MSQYSKSWNLMDKITAVIARVCAWALLAVSLLLVQCSSYVAPQNDENHYTDDEVYQKTEQLLDHGEYLHAVEWLEYYQSHYPDGAHAKAVQVHLVYANLAYQRYEDALMEADRYDRQYPRGGDADYVLYLRGTANLAMSGDLLEKWLGADPAMRDAIFLTNAEKAFRQLTTSYPRSPYAELAMQQLIRLQRMMASREVHTAMFYRDKDAYVACVKHAMNAVNSFADTEEAKQGADVAAECYRALKLEGMADQVLEDKGKVYTILPVNSKDE